MTIQNGQPTDADEVLAALAVVPVYDTWTYASPTTINVPSGAASKYKVGGKIKFTQTSDKFLSVVAVADKLLTVTGGIDYTVANAAITNIYYSHNDIVGFPAYFNWTGASGSNPQGFTGAITDTTVFSIRGRQVTIIPAIAGTSNLTTLTFTLPVAPSIAIFAPLKIRDNNTYATTPGLLGLTAGSVTATAYKDMAGGAWTNANAKAINNSPVTYFI